GPWSIGRCAVSAGARGARYAAMFARLGAAGEGGFIPFAMLGDPDPPRSQALVRALAAAGADALELGLPFSDPVADGPVIQAAASRALAAGVRRADCWNIVRTVRNEFPELPIGLLVYANLVCHRDAGEFYREAAAAGVDSVLVADLPVFESGPVAAAARAAGIAPVFIAPPNAVHARLASIAAAGEAYTYVTSREGVTGTDDRLRLGRSGLIARLKELHAPPPVLGFGIATPEHVRAALAMGAAAAISGSAVVRLAAEGGDVTAFVREMKRATKTGGGRGA
ncbi:MAG TPA: tryptophan synthase subunit alpha, partial [Gemmatimonadales bacterium]|nr:tryptophan synthase subunit alpha [Gemmatimonadales bacterium]